MHSASDKLYISDQIGSITAGGGTNLYPALQQAYFALTQTTAKLKHVIALSDGHSQPGDWYGIASSMRAENITMSTVGIGSGADMNLLGNLANWGGGRDYFTQDPYNVPQIFAKETVTASKSAIIDEPFIPQRIKPTQVLNGIDLEAAPFLLGYVSTQPRPTAEIFLVSDRGDPVLRQLAIRLREIRRLHLRCQSALGIRLVGMARLQQILDTIGPRHNAKNNPQQFPSRNQAGERDGTPCD